MMGENIASFLPPYVKTKTDWQGDYRLTVGDESLIISVFSISEILFAPFNSKIKYALG